MKLYTRDGQEVEVSPEEGWAQFHAGNLIARETDQFPVTDGQKIKMIPAADLARLNAPGFRFASEQEVAEKEWGDWGGTAFLLGAGDALTFGGASTLAAKLTSPETVKSIEDANQAEYYSAQLAAGLGSLLVPGLGETSGAAAIARGANFARQAVSAGKGLAAAERMMNAGKAAGTFATALNTQVMRMGLGLGKGVESAALSALARGGKDAGAVARVLARGVGTAAGGSLEGAIWGIGEGVKEEALGDPKPIGQALYGIMHSGLEGAQIGAVAGGLMGGAAEFVKRPTNRAINYTMTKMGDYLDSATLGAKLRTFEAFNVSQPQVSTMAPKLLERTGNKVGETADEFFDYAADLLQRPNMRGLPDKQPILRPNRNHDIHGNLKRLQRAENAVGERLGAIRDEAHAIIADTDPGGLPLFENIQAQIDNALAQQGVGDVVSREKMFDQIAKHLNSVKTKLGAETSPLTFREANANIVGWLGKNAREATDPGVKSYYRTAWEAAREYVDDLMESGLVKAGMVAPGKVRPDLMTEFDEMRRQYRVMARILTAGEKTGKFKNTMASGFKEAALYAGRAVGWNLVGGTAAPRLAAGMLRRFAVGMGTAGARDALGNMAGTANNIQRLERLNQEVRKMQENFLVAATALTSPRKNVTTLQKVVPAVTYLLHSTGTETPEDAVKVLREQASMAQNDPARFAELASAATMDLHEVAPNVAAELAATRARAALAVAKVLPPEDPRDIMQPNVSLRPISSKDLYRIATTYQVATDLGTGIARIARGDLPAQAIDVMREVAPEFMDTFARQAILAASLSEERLSPQALAKLEQVAGKQLLAQTKSDFIARAQQVYAQQREGRKPQLSQKNSNLQGVYQTGPQRLQSGVA